MPLLLIVTGILLLVLGYQGTYPQFFQLLKTDFSGPGNFWYWIVIIVAVGALGYIPSLSGLSKAFLFMVLIGLFLANGTGFFAQLQSGVQSTGQTQSALPQLSPPASLPSGVLE